MTSPCRALPLLLCVLSPSLGAEELPPHALARLGDYRFYHGPGIRCAVLSPDGSRVASAARYSDDNTQVSDQERQRYDYTIVLWNAATGERVRELRAPRGPLSHLAFSADGSLLAAACGGYQTRYSVAVFEAGSGKLLQHFGDFRAVARLHFSPDGKQLRVSEWLGPVTTWNATTGRPLRTWKPPALAPLPKGRDGVCAVCGLLSPDGKVIVWEMGHTNDGGATSPDSAGHRVYDVETDTLRYQIKGNCNHRIPLHFSADGKRFAGLGDRLHVWETATGKELISLDIQKIDRFALAPDGRHAAIYEASTYKEGSRVRLWDLEAGRAVRDLYSGAVTMQADLLTTSQAFSADGKTLLLASDTTLRLFDTTTGKEHVRPGHRSPVRPRFSADGRTLFTTCAELRRRWDVGDVPGKQPTLLDEAPRKPWERKALGRSADGKLFLDHDRGQNRVRETATGRVVSVLQDDRMYPHYALFTPDASRVLLFWVTGKKPLETGEYSLFWLCDVKTGKMLGKFEPEDLYSNIQFSNVVFSPNGQFLAWLDHDGNVQLRNPATGKSVRTLRSSGPLFEGDARPETATLEFSPNGEFLMATSYLLEYGKDNELRTPMLPLRLFQVSRGREVRRFYANPKKASKGSPLSCAAWSPDGRLLAVAEEGSGMIRLLEVAGGTVRAEFAGHRHGVYWLAFAPDGKTLASGGEDNVAFLWDVRGF
jgi:WD40 repeat protein